MSQLLQTSTELTLDGVDRALRPDADLRQGKLFEEAQDEHLAVGVAKFLDRSPQEVGGRTLVHHQALRFDPLRLGKQALDVSLAFGPAPVLVGQVANDLVQPSPQVAHTLGRFVEGCEPGVLHEILRGGLVAHQPEGQATQTRVDLVELRFVGQLRSEGVGEFGR